MVQGPSNPLARENCAGAQNVQPACAGKLKDFCALSKSHRAVNIRVKGGLASHGQLPRLVIGSMGFEGQGIHGEGKRKAIAKEGYSLNPGQPF